MSGLRRIISIRKYSVLVEHAGVRYNPYQRSLEQTQKWVNKIVYIHN